ncbi:FHIPEP family type III secretion protein [Pseudomonas sp. JV241A]|uniref:FHIPEP family type III secretion protein n=1 Tax=Pseudomonas sp. JV241A TaxID=2078785 RepID=UPI0023D94119|nr:FHIPEP family type III secretion protein [Pseudomonas sp. JV241A]
MLNLWLARLAARPELLILALMVMIIAMLIIPLPTVLVDFLIGLNIVLSLLIFMGSFYIERILSYSTFPALLLLTTLFRLALSISTSRLILTQADAGEIIASFGEFVIGENLVVGFVIFSIVTIVQFIVITKGSERVAEVAARFSLDGMPGKQMSIDGDLKAGAIDAAQARAKRSELERESQLYGSFDGAMKFIKGDAIAGIVIIFVNFIGGIAIGVGQLGMDLSTALSTFTLLTIGDGLVAQIPALLIAIGAGFIVTRVNGDEQNLGRNMLSQVLGNPFVLGVSALLALGVGLLPGFPLAVFVFIAITLVAVLWRRRRRAQQVVTGEGASPQPADDTGSAQGLVDIDNLNTETLPLLLLVPSTRLAELQQARFTERLRSQFFIDYGLRVPLPHLRAAQTLPEHQVTILINEVRADQFDLFFEYHRLLDFAEQLQDSGIEIKRGHDSNKPGGIHRFQPAIGLRPDHGPQCAQCCSRRRRVRLGSGHHRCRLLGVALVVDSRRCRAPPLQRHGNPRIPCLPRRVSRCFGTDSWRRPGYWAGDDLRRVGRIGAGGSPVLPQSRPVAAVSRAWQQYRAEPAGQPGRWHRLWRPAVRRRGRGAVDGFGPGGGLDQWLDRKR